MTLKAQSLHKRYGQKTVIEDVSLSVDRGEIIGLLGPNGAGNDVFLYHYRFDQSGCWKGLARPS